MPTWGQILNELKQTRAPEGQGLDFDGVRRKYLNALHDYTGRAVILYYSAFLESRPGPLSDLQVGLADVQGFMEAVSNVTDRQLDLIIHSPGGSAEAAESIVAYLRQRFDHIRMFVPVAAMSAATMVALAGNEIVMGQQSQLGPIDPQFIISTPEGPRSAPAKAILSQFESAKRECRDPSNLAAWMPILRTYAPGLLTQCADSEKLAIAMVSEWLEAYMFAGDSEAADKADKVAQWFATYENFRSHGRRVGREQAQRIGVVITELEGDAGLQEAILSVHHAAMHTLSATGAVKIIENHHGRAWVKLRRDVLVQGPQPIAPVQGRPPNRAERRRAQRDRR